ncbi:MAG: ABC transporter permease [Lachnospiraceae bacterium]|nr:ABC transporter permease [Lachnospiraceae bacterium]
MLGKLIKSNFKKDFSHMITFFLIMVLSVVLLHSGIMILMGYGKLFDIKKEELNSADLMVQYNMERDRFFELEELIASADYIASYEKINPIQKEFVKEDEEYDSDSKDAYDTSRVYLQCLPYGEWGEIEAPDFVELSEKEYDNPIYISINVNTNFFKVNLDDEIEVTVDGRPRTFHVAGIFQGMLSSYGITYVDSKTYNEWYNERQSRLDGFEEEGYSVYDFGIIYMKVNEGIKPQDAAGRLTRTFSEHYIMAYAWDVDSYITESVYMQNIVSAILSLFAIIITIISMIIIYFRISNSIEQNIVNMGALKALGYTSKQIRVSMVIEFAATTFAAVVTGIGLSYLIMPVIENGMRSFCGLVWDYNFDFAAALITALIIVGTVIVVSMASTKSITKLDPVRALRFGVSSKSFKKNPAPIERTSGPLTWILALKSILRNTKQNILLFVIMLSIGAVTTFAAYLTYNVIFDITNLYRMLNSVAPDVELSIDDDNALYELKNLPEVEYIWWMNYAEMTVEGYSVTASITEDWKDIPEVNVYEGRVPVYDNEITIGGGLAGIIGVTIGDEVNVSYGEFERKYIITGLQQGAQNDGRDISLNMDGARHLGYEFDKTSVAALVKGHTLDNSNKLVEDAEDMYGYKLWSYANAIDALENGENSIVTIAVAIVAMLIIISLLVIILSMNLLVKTIIIKRQRELGIKKAIGFSSSQLRMELVLSMMPQITIGGIVGAIIGCKGSNNMLTMMLNSLGIMRSNMKVFPMMGIVAVVFVTIVSFLIIWILSARIKKISAYSLITE